MATRKFTKIKGEDKPQNIVRLPRLGKIRLGIKKVSKQGSEYPAEVDYFVCPDEVKSKYGDNPTSIPVMIPVEDESMYLRQYYACYGGNQRLKCQGDGEMAARRDKDNNIEYVECPSPSDCDFGKKSKCSARTDLMVVLPEINCGGVYQLSTGSINSAIDVRSGIEMARSMFGRTSWVPMELKREEMKIPDPSTGKMQTHWPVKLIPTATLSEMNVIRSNTNRILDRQQNYALPEPVMEGMLVDTPTELVDSDGNPLQDKPILREAQEAFDGKTDNFEFLKVMGVEKKRVGDIAYYKILKMVNVSKSNQIIDRQDQELVFNTLRKLPKFKTNIPKDCPKDPNKCEYSIYDATDGYLCKGEFDCPYRKEDKTTGGDF